MKNTSLVALSLLAATFLNSCSYDDTRANDNNLAPIAANKKTVATVVATKQSPYNIRFGLVSRTGQKILSGSYDVGSFVAVNTTTGESFYSYYGGGFQTLPGYLTDQLPAGTYEFYAEQGQGGWVGYGSTTITLNDSLVDKDGYITVYIPIKWEE